MDKNLASKTRIISGIFAKKYRKYICRIVVQNRSSSHLVRHYFQSKI